MKGYIKKRLNRVKISVLAGMLAAILFQGNYMNDQKNILMWWGSIYPRFCFSEEACEEKTEENVRPKISFWLAKALERW